MAVGETSGQCPARSCPRRPRPGAGPPTAETEAEATPLVKEADPELERLLAEEEEIDRTLRQHHETPKFHGDGD